MAAEERVEVLFLVLDIDPRQGSLLYARGSVDAKLFRKECCGERKNKFLSPKVLNNTAYSFGSRFENGAGTKPEELVAAAHAGCFSMALAGILNESGLTPEKIETMAEPTMEKLDAGWTVIAIHLDMSARVPKATPAAFAEAARKAETGCPISRLLKCRITMAARLE